MANGPSSDPQCLLKPIIVGIEVHPTAIVGTHNKLQLRANARISHDEGALLLASSHLAQTKVTQTPPI